MASNTVEQPVDAAEDQPNGPLKPLTMAARRLGADALAEQRELLALLLDSGPDCESERELSGFAKRGLLMRILDLSDVAYNLFEGMWSDDFLLASDVYGTGHQASNASCAMRAQAEAAHG